ncbi:class F sortase [Kitasatospora sp. NPDC001309]|uniref:class F sortase n=1 Tax=Kitasatospora sp. NPDC001309 TaxID=3364013 RepID=UPI00368270EF
MTRTRVTVVAVAVAAAALLTACGGRDSPVLPAAPEIVSTATASPATAAASLPKSRPTGLKIGSAGVDAKRMVDLKIDDKGELGVPDPDKEADLPGWWEGSPTPGEPGASVLVAHFDTRHGPALMKDVEKIRLGDRIAVPREDGTTAVFAVREIEKVDKKAFPTEKVYGATDRPELRLLTCGGEIRDGHRTGNVIFYADLVPA